MKSTIFILSLFLVSSTFAQETTATDTSWKKIYRAEATKINDLVNTKLDVRFDYAKAYMYGKAWITLHPHFYPTDTLTLDAKGMNINEVALYTNGKRNPLKYIYKDSLQLLINLNKTYTPGENYTIYIDYVSKPNEFKSKGSAAITDARGLYFINPMGKEKNKHTEIWTQGETEANSVWMPTIDKPNQKSTEEITMTVPAKYVTLSNGLLTSQKTNTDGTRTDTWKMSLPHAPYLFFMGVGDYSIIKDSYKGKEVAYYVEKEYAPVARKIFGNTPEMIKFYSDKLGIDFPWPKYNQIVGRDYVSGAMENTTSTLHGEAAYQNARQLKDGNTWEDVIAHELFHQWFGDLVTAESWSNITVNESFAQFSETLWNEYKHGKDAGNEASYNDMQQYLRSNSEEKPLVRFYYADKEDVFDNVSYPKGARILNMLRNYVGDAAFFASLHKYLTDNKFKTGEAQQLRLAFESVTGRDLNWFWNEWYYGAGHPMFNINYAYNDAAGKATIVVQQNQNTGSLFRVPVAIDVYEGANKSRYNVWLQNKTDTFTFSYKHHPDLINFDGDKILLCQKTDHKTDSNYIAQMKYAPLFGDRREALAHFASKKMTNELSLGLKDSYAPLRSYTLTSLMKDSAAMRNPTILASVRNLVQTEHDNKTKAKAIELLAATRDVTYKPVFEKYVNDSSYSVSAAALTGLSFTDSANALKLAQKYSSDAKGNLATVVMDIELKYGTEQSFDNLAGIYNELPPNQEKLAVTVAFCNYLSRLNDTAKIKQGIDMVIKYRNKIPATYHPYVDPAFRQAFALITKAKGNALKEYVNNAFK